ncbi:hypothetical protein Pla175_27780 [Pirellulimonas nuda]|uniref:Uncharacterized protein n=1 Tax=Pirellulimonas nuda TaxID=2528009 RepID=A0A518DD33_9BACT|nr:hypothetical protein Pla175_27780 [Pirellulimonas nuda]
MGRVARDSNPTGKPRARALPGLPHGRGLSLGLSKLAIRCGPGAAVYALSAGARLELSKSASLAGRRVAVLAGRGLWALGRAVTPAAPAACADASVHRSGTPRFALQYRFAWNSPPRGDFFRGGEGAAATADGRSCVGGLRKALRRLRDPGLQASAPRLSPPRAAGPIVDGAADLASRAYEGRLNPRDGELSLPVKRFMSSSRCAPNRAAR